MDEKLKLNKWKIKDAYPYYDEILLRNFTNKLEVYRKKNLPLKLIEVLNGFRNNFGNSLDRKLYSNSFYGSKIVFLNLIFS